MMGAEILAGEADIECATPFLGADFINAACGACNAGIVDENIEAAECLADFIEEVFDFRIGGNVRLGAPGIRVRAAEISQKRVGDIANVDLCALIKKEIGYGAANAGGSRCNKNAGCGWECERRLSHGVRLC